MIKQIPGTYKYTKIHNAFITSLGVLKGHEWDKPAKGYTAYSPESIRRNSGMDAVKLFIRKKLEASHKQKHKNLTEIHCAFCGLRMNVTSNDQIEHFSPKSKLRTPAWMFLPDNLILACTLCNGPKGKGNKDVIKKKGATYKKYEFKIVHPKLDDPAKHYKYTDTRNLVLVKSKCSSRGKLSVEWFKLDKKPKTMARINEYMENAYKVDWKNGTINFDTSFGKKHFSK
jgi:uncharacterized protein (TIGR02646 family)